MVQILNKNPKSFGEAFGESLQRYGENKLKHIEARNVHQNASQRLQALGLGAAEADYLATLPPKEQSALLQSYSQGSQPQQQQQLPYDQNDPRAMAQFHLDRALKQQQGQELEPMGTGLGSQPAQQSPAPIQQMATQQQPPQEAPTFLQAIGRGSPASSAINDRKQAQINSANKTYNTAFEKRRTNAEREKELVDEALNLLESGDVASGLWGLLPETLQNDTTQQFDSAVNELATILAERGGGPGSKYRTQLAQQIKASSTKGKKAQRALLERVRSQANKVGLEEDIRNQLIEENKGNQPNNFSDLVSKRLKQLSARDLQAVSGEEKSALPSVSEYENKDIIEDDETGNRYQLIDKVWYKIGE